MLFTLRDLSSPRLSLSSKSSLRIRKTRSDMQPRLALSSVLSLPSQTWITSTPSLLLTALLFPEVFPYVDEMREENIPFLNIFTPNLRLDVYSCGFHGLSFLRLHSYWPSSRTVQLCLGSCPRFSHSQQCQTLKRAQRKDYFVSKWFLSSSNLVFQNDACTFIFIL